MFPDLFELPVIMIYAQIYVLDPLFHDISLIYVIHEVYFYAISALATSK